MLPRKGDIVMLAKPFSTTLCGLVAIATATLVQLPAFGQVPGPPGAYYYNGNLTKGYASGVDFAHSIEDLYAAQGGSSSWNQLLYSR